MERPILTLGPKEFLRGLSGSAHSVYGGLFYTARGLSPLRDLGDVEEENIGLLQTAPVGTGSGTLSDVPIVGDKDFDPAGTSSYLYIIGSEGHFYKTAQGTVSVTDLRSSTPITSPSNGVAVFAAAGGTKYLYYWQNTQIGRWDLSGSYPTGWTDNHFTGLENVQSHPTHKLFDAIYYGNDYKVGAITDDGAASVTHNTNVLDFPSHLQVTALEDDGVYLVIAVASDKKYVGANVDTRIVFWDTSSSSWSREYRIADPAIADMKRIGNIVYAIGRYGIYTVSFGGGIQKVWQGGAIATATRGPAILSSFNDSLLIGNTGAGGKVALLGRPSPLLPFAYHELFVINAASNNAACFVDGEFSSGVVIIGDQSPALKSYHVSVSGGGNATGLSFQTIYIPFREPTQVHRIDVIFGEPLASGDAFDIDTKVDEDTAAVDFDSASFTSDGAIRRKSMYPAASVEVNNQLSIIGNFTGGAAKIKRIEVYGQPLTLGTT